MSNESVPFGKGIVLVTGREAITVRDCKHELVAVNAHRRVLECKGCEQIIEPFDFIVAHAKQAGRITLETGWLTGDRDKLRAEVEDLKRERNIRKAKQRNAGG